MAFSWTKVLHTAVFFQQKASIYAGKPLVPIIVNGDMVVSSCTGYDELRWFAPLPEQTTGVHNAYTTEPKGPITWADKADDCLEGSVPSHQSPAR